MFDRVIRDITFALRSLICGRGVTAVAVTSLALGIAANATIFSLVQAVEFPSLIYPEPSRIVFLESRNHARGLIGMPVSAPDALDIAAASRTLELASLTADQTSILRQGSAPKRISGRRVQPTFFDVLRVAPSLGRVLAGVIIAAGATRALSSFLFDVSPTDPVTFATVIAFLTIVAVAACYRPARIAATADPMAILRQ